MKKMPPNFKLVLQKIDQRASMITDKRYIYPDCAWKRTLKYIAKVTRRELDKAAMYHER